MTSDRAMTSNLGFKLSFISLALFLAYGAVVLTGILPISLLDANWQLRLCSVLVENAALPLVGMAITHLAMHLDGSNLSLRAYHGFISRWALVVALGFLLLVPLQVVSSWRLYAANIQGQSGNEQSVVSQRFEGMRLAITGASSPADLKSRLQAAGGPSLSEANLATSLPVLRAKLLVSLEQAKRNAMEQFGRAKPSILWSLLQRCFHVTISTLGFSLAFAASAQRPDSELTVLQEWSRLRKRKSQHDATRSAEKQRKSLLARVEAWQAKRAYHSKLRSSRRASQKQMAKLKKKTHSKEILKDNNQNKDS
ncbi:hypothetical protein [Synechococcus sp. CCAP 1479/9]|uniref:hypothetical protein n=1 Tax=Synechococcus sp. CCAP 1479/9 TaxID=1221593 RepID=UPI001C22E060|nr:hypothetical protein [Synechococcus sp. CCAP 1479/9]